MHDDWLDAVRYAVMYGTGMAKFVPPAKDDWATKEFKPPFNPPPLDKTSLVGRMYMRYFQGVKSELKTQALLLGVTYIAVNAHLSRVMYDTVGRPFSSTHDDFMDAFMTGTGHKFNTLNTVTHHARSTGKSMAHAMAYGGAVHEAMMKEPQPIQATPPRAPMNGPVARKPFNQASRQSFKALIRQSRRNR